MLEEILSNSLFWPVVAGAVLFTFSLYLRKFYWFNAALLTAFFLGLYWIFLPLAILFTSVALIVWFNVTPLFPLAEELAQKSTQKQQVGSDWILGGLCIFPWVLVVILTFKARKTAKEFFGGIEKLPSWNARLEIPED